MPNRPCALILALAIRRKEWWKMEVIVGVWLNVSHLTPTSPNLEKKTPAVSLVTHNAYLWSHSSLNAPQEKMSLRQMLEEGKRTYMTLIVWFIYQHFPSSTPISQFFISIRLPFLLELGSENCERHSLILSHTFSQFFLPPSLWQIRIHLNYVNTRKKLLGKRKWWAWHFLQFTTLSRIFYQKFPPVHGVMLDGINYGIVALAYYKFRGFGPRICGAQVLLVLIPGNFSPCVCRCLLIGWSLSGCNNNPP